MNSSPPEILTLICSFACTDDGSAGRALAAMSRYVRQVSAPFQWQSLAIAGTRQTVAFAALLDDVSGARSTSPAAIVCRRPIYHLFVSNRTQDTALDMRHAALGATRDMDERRAINRTFDAEADAWRGAVQRILAYAAKSARTLTLACYDIHASPAGRLLFADIARLPFAHLEELTLRGGVDARRVPENRDRDAGPPLPKLTHLHLIAPLPFDALLPHIRARAPRLARLRLSELSPSEHRLAVQLFAELAARDAVPPRLARTFAAEPVDWAPLLPPRLARLVVQPGPIPPAPDRLCGCCSGYFRMSDMVQLLGAMAQEARDDTYVYLPPPDGSRPGCAFKNVYGDWVDRAHGGNGCWEDAGSRRAAGGASMPPPQSPKEEDCYLSVRQSSDWQAI